MARASPGDRSAEGRDGRRPRVRRRRADWRTYVRAWSLSVLTGQLGPHPPPRAPTAIRSTR